MEKRLDKDGDEVEVQGSGSKPYRLKVDGAVISCSCPAWRNQSLPIDKRTCKHIKQVRGAAAEEKRLGSGPTTGYTPERAVLDEYAKVTPEQFDRAVKASAAGSVAAERHASGVKLRQDEKAKLFGPPVLLAHKYERNFDPTGWWVSEKLDGVRAYWNGVNFITRQGNVYNAPHWFTADLPNIPLDGELWIGRQRFQETISVVKSFDSGERWRKVKFVIFDAPEVNGDFEHRQRVLNALMRNRLGNVSEYAEVLLQIECQSAEWLEEELLKSVALGAEGLMLREPGSMYEAKRSNTLLKMKPANDAEGVVVGHEPGKGRHVGRVGGLVVEFEGRRFNLGTGLSDKQRDNPPAVGSIVTFKYTELTRDGIPKCASFVAVRSYE